MDEDSKDGLMIFGRDVSKIPCFRNTFIRSISSGLCATMLTFLLTSKTKKSVQVGMYTYAGVTISYWIYCRYNYAVDKFNNKALQEAIKQHQLRKGVMED